MDWWNFLEFQQMERVSDVEGACALVVENAEKAAQAGTFGVGGLLLGPDGTILASVRNRVLVDGKVHDPTAHGERQLVDWYFGEIHKGRDLPPPSELTVISSLDPCMMCAGSILSAGMRALVLAPDDRNGVNYQDDLQFSTLPKELRATAQQSLGYIGVEGQRNYRGGETSLFGKATVSSELTERSLKVFNEAQLRVQILVAGQDEPHGCDSDEAALKALQSEDPKALTLTTSLDDPGPELASLLWEKAQQDPGSQDAACLLDSAGRVLLCCAGETHISPIRTPFMQLTRAYCRARAQAPQLPHIKHCTVLTVQGPGRKASNIAELGAYGSSIEGPLPQDRPDHWLYLEAAQSPDELEAMISDLPPLYSELARPRFRHLQSELQREFGRLKG